MPTARPLLTLDDQGDPRLVTAAHFEPSVARGNWVESFLQANHQHLRRLDIRPEVVMDPAPAVALHPGARIGAMPLLHPATRKVTAGLLVRPRFRWPSLGSVFSGIGFAVEPALGGAPLVPGSAREVPPWLIAGPVLRRLEALLARVRRTFSEVSEERAQPRGRIDWTAWGSRHLPSGRWTTFPCTFAEPAADPELMMAVRWTLERLEDELTRVGDTLPGRALLSQVATLRHEVGGGPSRRVLHLERGGFASEWMTAAVEAMGWIAEERGLGGARTLDGLAWHLCIDEVWEAWVRAFAATLAPRLGLSARAADETRRRLRWSDVRSMEQLIPDAVLEGSDRVVWLDAKYKSHLALLARHGWQGLSEHVRDAHRADLHQALAYATLTDIERVDTVLVYPELGTEGMPLMTAAEVTSGRRRVRLLLAGLPFGWRSVEQRRQTETRWGAWLGV